MSKTQTNTHWHEIVKAKLEKHKSNVIYDDLEHTYTLKRTNKQLTSISAMLSSFKLGIDKIPKDIMEKAQTRGIVVHYIAEKLFNHEIISKDKVYEYAETIANYDAIEHSYLIENLINVYEKLMKPNPIEEDRIFFTEQLLYYNKDEVAIAGTCDLISIVKISDTLCVQIIDWKTGNLRPENNAQVSLYQYMLKSALKGIKIDGINLITFESVVISLKDNQNNFSLIPKKED